LLSHNQSNNHKQSQYLYLLITLLLQTGIHITVGQSACLRAWAEA